MWDHTTLNLCPIHPHNVSFASFRAPFYVPRCHIFELAHTSNLFFPQRGLQRGWMEYCGREDHTCPL